MTSLSHIRTNIVCSERVIVRIVLTIIRDFMKINLACRIKHGTVFSVNTAKNRKCCDECNCDDLFHFVYPFVVWFVLVC